MSDWNLHDYPRLLGGFVLLLDGAEFLVRGAVQLAARLGVPPLIVGLTVVVCCTTMPELFVSLEAAFRGAPGIAVGSNICSLLLILGAAACVWPLAVVEPREVRFEGLTRIRRECHCQCGVHVLGRGHRCVRDRRRAACRQAS